MKTLLVTLALLVGAIESVTAAERFDPGHRLGFSLGTPAGLNLEYAHEFGARSVFLSGGYYGTSLAYGVQGGLSAVRWGSMRKHFALNVVAGHAVPEERERWTYAGVEAAFHYRRVFAAPGLSVGDGTYSSPQLLVRLGFAWPL